MTKKPLEDGENDKESEASEESQSAATTESMPELVTIDSKDDHRIAMAFAVLGTAIGGITINGAECVTKTFPQFWDTLKSIGGELETNGE